MMNENEIKSLNWEKVGGLMPAVIQDAATLQVLMLGYMNQEALMHSLESGKVTFYSRTKKRLWTKGETSGNDLTLVSITVDCDQDTLLVQVNPQGDSCHLDNPSCFGKCDAPGVGILSKLEKVIRERAQTKPQGSYVSQLLQAGIQRIAQKVGEEGIETALAAVAGPREELINEAVDLLFHLLVLLRASQVDLSEVMHTLHQRSS